MPQQVDSPMFGEWLRAIINEESIIVAWQDMVKPVQLTGSSSATIPFVRIDRYSPAGCADED
ncbi:MAG TPA: hypothetical protein VJ047_01615 [Pseudomonas sp.]|nr:hypothetical protein [Pseudomonas sp.]